MRVAGITALGEPVEIFEVDELATPAAGEVLIDVVAAGIGNWDELVRQSAGRSAARLRWRSGRRRPRRSPRGREPSPSTYLDAGEAADV
jgi:NADPH:quinone reductase-like Zn-dependent oxidoreductase